MCYLRCNAMPCDEFERVQKKLLMINYMEQGRVTEKILQEMMEAENQGSQHNIQMPDVRFCVSRKNVKSTD